MQFLVVILVKMAFCVEDPFSVKIMFWNFKLSEFTHFKLCILCLPGIML